MENKILSPCNSHCEIDLVTQLCKGCYRYMDEIINWEIFSKEKRMEITKQTQRRKKSFEEN